MIVLENVSKLYPGAASPAVDGVSMTIPEGTSVALIGPSGCGKTTTMRMLNRLVEPSAGRILVDGRDVATVDPIALRRSIGYVIQQVGLFPHWTVADNIAAVPRMLGWPAARIRARTEELLDLVGLDPAATIARYPRQLSGGQRQRVGVARALAIDPPILLMDEPFGAIDPVARARIQDEFREILRKVRKTVVIVTHDLDEALRLGDRLAIMRAGRLVQYDTSDVVLARPADAFVQSFVGADGPLRRLGLLKVDDFLVDRPDAAGTTRLSRGASLRDALSALVASGEEAIAIEDGEGRVHGYIHRSTIFTASGLPAAVKTI